MALAPVFLQSGDHQVLEVRLTRSWLAQRREPDQTFQETDDEFHEFRPSTAA
jgi:hypothetical protein